LINKIQPSCKKTVRAFRLQLPEKNEFFDVDENTTELWNSLSKENSPAQAAGLKTGYEILTYALTVSEFQEINKFNDDPEELLTQITNQSQKGNSNKNSSPEKVDGSENDMEIDDDEDDAEDEQISDHLFLVYKLNILQDYDQVLRYCFSPKSRPLFYSSKGLFDHHKVPKCERCGAERVFEFQVNNTILNYYEKLKDLDWGVVCTYSCSESCFGKESGEFAEEVILIQHEVLETAPQPDAQQENVKAEQELARLLVEELSLESKEMFKKQPPSKKIAEKPKKKDVAFYEDDWN